MEHPIEEARHEGNLVPMSDVRGQLVTAQCHLKALQGELAWTLEVVKRADERAALAESHRNEALLQLSFLENV